DLRRAVEGRTGLVVDDRGAEAAEPAKNGRQLRAHPLRRAAAALAGNPHRPTVRKLPAVLLRGYAGEEHAAHAGKRQRLEHVGGAREIIAVVGVKRPGHCGFSAAEGRERLRELWVAARIFGQGDAGYRGLPALMQTPDTCGDASGMTHDAAAAGVDEVDRAKRAIGVRRLQGRLPRREDR